MPRQNLTLEQMHQNIARMEVLEQRDSFTDDEMHEISALFEGFWGVPGTDELDTPETTDSGVEEDGTSWALGEGWSRNRDKYHKAEMKLYERIKKAGQKLYYDWLSFLDRYPRPESDSKPGIHGETYVKKISCCLCKLIHYADEHGQNWGGGLQASFFRRSDKFETPDKCRCEQYKKWGLGTEEQEKTSHCCYRTVGSAVGSELASGCSGKYTMIHCCGNCQCFKKQKVGDTHMLSGWYGSAMADCVDYLYVGPEEKFIDDGCVCDWCINDMVRAEELIKFHEC